MFVPVVVVSESASIIALLESPVSVEKISPLFTIVVLSAPVDALPRIVLPSDLIIPPLLFVIDTPSELNKLIALETFVEIVPELFISNSPPSVDIVFAAVDVTDEPECIVSIVPAVSLLVFFIAF